MMAITVSLFKLFAPTMLCDKYMMGKYGKCQGCYGLSLFVKPTGHPCWAPKVQRPLPCSPCVAQIFLSSCLPPTAYA